MPHNLFPCVEQPSISAARDLFLIAQVLEAAASKVKPCSSGDQSTDESSDDNEASSTNSDISSEEHNSDTANVTQKKGSYLEPLNSWIDTSLIGIVKKISQAMIKSSDRDLEQVRKLMPTI